jgi:tRNA U34 5-methylaminomethyl-2-thiouridine-forming methyltransferase MnmC
VHSLAYGETMHPANGPVAEAKTLYVRQLRLRARLKTCSHRFVIWDVGLGAAANVLTVYGDTGDIPGETLVLSFDKTMAPLIFALQNADALEYFGAYRFQAQHLVPHRRVSFVTGQRAVEWRLLLHDFPTLISDPASAALPKPDAILYDPFSPKANPDMWTLPLLTSLYGLLERPCALATYSRSTLLRVTLLLAGFFVGTGEGMVGKEEATVAANTLELIAQPLDRKWLRRVQQSASAEPLLRATYCQSPLSEATWQRLRSHAQFA